MTRGFLREVEPKATASNGLRIFLQLCCGRFFRCKGGPELDTQLALPASLCRMELSWSVWEKWIRTLCLAETSTMAILNLQRKDTGFRILPGQKLLSLKRLRPSKPSSRHSTGFAWLPPLERKKTIWILMALPSEHYALNWNDYPALGILSTLAT